MPAINLLVDLAELADHRAIDDQGGVGGETQLHLERIQVASITRPLLNEVCASGLELLSDLVELELCQSRRLAVDQGGVDLDDLFEGRDVAPGVLDELDILGDVQEADHRVARAAAREPERGHRRTK